MIVPGTVLACLYLPVPFFMIWLHAFHRVRGDAGAAWYLLHAVVYLGLVSAVAGLAPVWSTGAWAWPVAVRAAGAILVAGAAALLALTYRKIDSWTAMGGPQVTGRRDRPLITTGVYGVVRHPRYTVLLVAALGNFLLTGFPLLLAVFAVTVALTLVVVQMEERELVAFFGASYRRYRERVPALLPRSVRLNRHAGPRRGQDLNE